MKNLSARKTAVFVAIAVGVVVILSIVVSAGTGKAEGSADKTQRAEEATPSRLVLATCHRAEDLAPATQDLFENAAHPDEITLSVVAVVPDGTDCARTKLLLEREVARLAGREREESQVRVRCVNLSNFRGSLQTFLKVLEEDYEKQDQIALFEDLPSIRMNMGWDAGCWGDTVRTCVPVVGRRAVGFLGWDKNMGRRVHTREGGAEETPSLGATLRAVSGGMPLLKALILAKKFLHRGTIVHGDAVLSSCIWMTGSPVTLPDRPWFVTRSAHTTSLPGGLSALRPGAAATRAWLSRCEKALAKHGIGTRDAELGLTRGHSAAELICKWGSSRRYRELVA